MSVYKINFEDLAKFISDIKFGFKLSSVTSTEGWRCDGARYKISVQKINCDRIQIVNDCFINYDGSVTVISYIPEINYHLISNELSACYNNTHLPFEFKANSKVIRYKIGNDTKLKSFEDFQDCVDCLIEYIGQNIEHMINEFNGGQWNIEDVICDITWQVDKFKR